MNQKIKEDKDWIYNWFIQCESYGINPWEWDFKTRYCMDEHFPKDENEINFYGTFLYQTEMYCGSYYNRGELYDGIEYILKEKNGELEKENFITFSKSPGGKGNPETEAKSIYNVLFSSDELSSANCTTMNSFIETLNQYILHSKNKENIFKEIGLIPMNKEQTLNYKLMLKNKNYLKFDLVEENLKELNEFANLTHTIGNFTVLPHGRSVKEAPYWGMTLKTLKDTIESFTEWKEFIELYSYNGYVSKKGKVLEFSIQNYLNESNINIEVDDNELRNLLKNINQKIIHRGKILTKRLCDKLQITEFWFYKELEDIEVD